MMNNIMVQDLAVNESTINSSVYLDSNVRQLKLASDYFMQQDNDPKHRSKSTTEGIKT